MACNRPFKGLFSNADTFIQRTKKLYIDTRTQRNINKLNEDLTEVHSIMTKNIQDVLGQGEKLDSKQPPMTCTNLGKANAAPSQALLKPQEIPFELTLRLGMAALIRHVFVSHVEPARQHPLFIFLDVICFCV